VWCACAPLLLLPLPLCSVGCPVHCWLSCESSWPWLLLRCLVLAIWN
jgi:hypothetical protein